MDRFLQTTRILQTASDALSCEHVSETCSGDARSRINSSVVSYSLRSKCLERTKILVCDLYGGYRDLEQERAATLHRVTDLKARVDRLKQRLFTSSKALEEGQISLMRIESANVELRKEVANLTEKLEMVRKCLSKETKAKVSALSDLARLTNGEERGDARIVRLKEQLKDSIPAVKVQELLQMAESRVSQICNGTKHKISSLQADIIRERFQNEQLRAQLKKIEGQANVESRLNHETALRKRAEARASDEARKVKILEGRIKIVEEETVYFRDMLQEAKEGISIMRTIAKIRDTNIDGMQKTIGFDAIAEKIESINAGVRSRLKRLPQKPSGGSKDDRPEFLLSRGTGRVSETAS